MTRLPRSWRVCRASLGATFDVEWTTLARLVTRSHLRWTDRQICVDTEFTGIARMKIEDFEDAVEAGTFIEYSYGVDETPTEVIIRSRYRVAATGAPFYVTLRVPTVVDGRLNIGRATAWRIAFARRMNATRPNP